MSNKHLRKLRDQGLCARCGVKSRQYRCDACRAFRRERDKGLRAPIYRERQPLDEAEFIDACMTGEYTRHGLAKKFRISKNRIERLLIRLDLDIYVKFSPITINTENHQTLELPEPTKIPTPTGAIPGSSEKVEVLRKRFEAGEHLFHALDADHEGYRPAVEKFTFSKPRKRWSA